MPNREAYLIDKDIFQERLSAYVDRFVTRYSRNAEALAIAKTVRFTLGVWSSDIAVGQALLLIVQFERSEAEVLNGIAMKLMASDITN